MNTYTVTNKESGQSYQYKTNTELSKRTARLIIKSAFGIGAHGTVSGNGQAYKVNSKVTKIEF